MISRRDYLKLSMMAGAAGLIPARLVQAMHHEGLIKRAIPKTGEELPIVGLGSSASFRDVAESNDTSPIRDVLKTLVDNGGSVFDTAPGYGASEEVAGRIAQELDIEDRIFWATKLNVVPRGGNKADPAAARRQIERSFEFIGKDAIDLIQVHNMADVATQVGVLKELKQDGRVRYIGVTYTGNASRYPDLVDVMRNEPIDFIGIDYAIDNRDAAELVFPVAQERGVAVMVYLPFGRSRLWNRVAGRELPDWAAGLGASTWAQFFIKYAAAHPAVTVVTPATSKAHHMLDNLGAAMGELPDAAMQQRMAGFIDSLPDA